MATGPVDILSGALKSQLTAIKSIARTVDEVQLRLATGKSVNSAFDDPLNFFTAQALDNRANDISRRLDGIGQSIRTLQTAESGVEAALRLLDTAEAYLQDIEQRYAAGEIELIGGGPPTNLTEILPTAGDFTSYAGAQDSGGPVTVTNGGADFELDGNLWKRLLINYTVTADTVLEFEYASTLTPEISAIGFETDNNFSNDNDRFFLNGTQFGGLNYSAPIPTYQYTGGGAYESYSIPIGTLFTGTYSHITFINDDDAAPLGNAAFRNVTLREGPLNTSLVAPPELQEGYEALLDQLDRIAVDANYRGINLLQKENLTTAFNEARTSTLITEGIDATSKGLGLQREDFASIEAVQLKIEQVREARLALREYLGTLASDLNIVQTREDFTRNTISILQSGRDDLVLDDANETGAELLALQVRQQIQFSTLASPQASITDFL